MHVVCPLGEEHIALTLAPHQRQALTGQRLLDELRGAAALEGEVHVALIGDHRSLPRHERFAKADAKQLRILIGDRFGLFLAEASVDQIAGDAGESVTGRLRRPRRPAAGVAHLAAAVGRPAAGRPSEPGRPDLDVRPDRSSAARPTSDTRSGLRDPVANFQVLFLSWQPN